MKSKGYKRKKVVSGGAKHAPKKRTIAANLQALCNAIGTTRDTYTRYRYHHKAPARLHDGYDVEAWRAFLREMGVTTNTERREALVVGDLKAEILAEDLETRRIEKRRLLGELIDRAEADERLVMLASIFAADLTNLRDRVSSIAKDGAVRVVDVHTALSDCMANVRQKVAEQKFAATGDRKA